MNSPQLTAAALLYVPHEFRAALRDEPRRVDVNLTEGCAFVSWALKDRPEVTLTARVSLAALSEHAEIEI